MRRFSLLLAWIVPATLLVFSVGCSDSSSTARSDDQDLSSEGDGTGGDGTSQPTGSDGQPLSSGALSSGEGTGGDVSSSSSRRRSSSSMEPCVTTPLPGTFSVGGQLWVQPSQGLPAGTLKNDDVVMVAGDDPEECAQSVTDVAQWGFNFWNPYGCTTGSAVSMVKVTGGCVANQMLGGAGTGCLQEDKIDWENLRPDIQDLLPKHAFDLMFLQRCSPKCQSHAGNLFTYENFLLAASHFPQFAGEGTEEQRKRELAAFLANASHETTGGWDTAPGGQHAWGLCNPEELNYYNSSNIGYTASQDNNCQPAAGKSYHGRGAIQLSYPSNYCKFSTALYGDKEVLRLNPERVLSDGEAAWASGIFFWMTEDQVAGTAPYNGVPPTGAYYKPSCHMAMLGNWTPRAADIAANRVSGFGVTINIINGGLECGGAAHTGPADRAGFYRRYCDLLDVDPIPSDWSGSESQYLECANQEYFR